MAECFQIADRTRVCGKSQQKYKELFERITALYEEGRTRDPEVFKDSIRLTPEKLRTVVGYLEGVHLSETDLDSKGKAFETFLDSFFRGDFGQYFTPRPIVRFIVEVLPIKHDSLVLDTSCGSGGFLLHALDKVRHGRLMTGSPPSGLTRRRQRSISSIGMTLPRRTCTASKSTSR